MIRRILLFRWLTILFMLLHSFADLPAARGSARSSPATPTAGHHVAFWPLDEPAGSTVAGDLTGNGHYGTLSSGVTAGSAGPPTGDGTTSMAFHGADQVTVASMAGLPSGAHPSSLEAWVDMAGGGAANEGLVGYGNYGSTRQASLLRTNGWAGLFTSWWNDDLWANGSATLIGGWHLATATYDGHARRLYLDGAPFAADAPASQPNVKLLNLALGQTGGGDYLTGSLANVAIYPYALTPAQVGRHYALGEHSPAPTPTTSVLQYSYDGAGRLNSIVYPDGGRENHSDYDPAGRVTHISLPDYTDYYLSYNGAGQRTQLAFPNGGKEYWAYDPAGRPHDTWWAGPGGTVPFTQTATLDAAGQRTVLQDTAGSTTYGYDGAGRLTAASYPGGSTEADQYDPLGDRTVITNTTVLSGTAVTTNSFDAAAQLGTSVVTGWQPGTTTYTYDGNGAQTGSSGPAGATTNTFNQQGQLTRVSGPATSEAFVYDGQGDRLRAYDQSTTNYQLHTLVQDLRPGVLSGLLSDGPTDYAYADFGVGAAPIARMAADANQGTYLAADLLGSVRLATNPSDQTLGSATYDAWGTARPVTADAAGQVLLAGLQASAPFGYAGQQYDAGPGTYGMRARQYDPAQGRFQSVDPLLGRTGQPYAYANDQPTLLTDPGGMAPNPATDGYVMASPYGNYESDFKNAIKGTFIAHDPAGLSFHDVRSTGNTNAFADLVSFNAAGDMRGAQVGEIYRLVPDADANRPQGAGWGPNKAQCAGNQAGQVPVACDYKDELDALHALQGHSAGLTYYGNGPALLKGECRNYAPVLYLGVDYPMAMSVATSPRLDQGPTFNRAGPVGPYRTGSLAQVPYLERTFGGTTYHIFVRKLAPGVLGYSVCARGDVGFGSGSSGCEEPGHYKYNQDCAYTGLAGVPLCTLDFFLGGSVSQAARCAPQDDACHSAVWFGLMKTAFAFSIGGVGAKALEDVAVPRALGNVGIDELRAALDRAAASADKPFVRVVKDGKPYILSASDARSFVSKIFTCKNGCFPGDTKVATPHGSVAIASLHVGDLVLAEDPKAGTVEPERVQAVINDAIQPLLGIDLGDGSTITATSNHLFWVDSGSGLSGAGWLEAGQLRAGDQLRTAGGLAEVVRAVRWNVGEAVVYTLTVANDHTFFVGAARVLVHNCFYDTSGYPSIPDVRTGSVIALPEGQFNHGIYFLIPKSDRVLWESENVGGSYINPWRQEYIRLFEQHFPPNSPTFNSMVKVPGTNQIDWSLYDIHHILPREYGGANNFRNLTPLQARTRWPNGGISGIIGNSHTQLTTWWNSFGSKNGIPNLPGWGRSGHPISSTVIDDW